MYITCGLPLCAEHVIIYIYIHTRARGVVSLKPPDEKDLSQDRELIEVTVVKTRRDERLCI